MSQNYVYPSSSTITLTAEGPNGTPIPGDSILIAGENPSMNLQPLQTDASGNLLVNVAAGTISAENPSVSLTATPVPTYATYAGMNVGGSLVGLTGTANGLKVDGSSVTQPVSAASLPLPTGAATSANQSTEITALGTINTTLGSPFQAGGSIGNTSFIATQSSGANLHVDIDNFPAIQPVSGTVAVSNFPATQPISAVSLPLPAGAATSAIQTNGTQTTQIVQGGNTAAVTASSALKVDGSAVTQPVSGTVAVTQSTSPWVNNITQFGSNPVITGAGASGVGIPRVTVSNDSNILATQSGTWNINNISGTISLPTGAATAAGLTDGTQKTQIVDGSGNVIASTSNALNVDVTNTIATSAPVNTNGSFSQAGISVATTIAKPANAIGFLLEADSANTDFMRWTDSNSTASATNGMKLEPGRDTGFMPMAHDLSICPNSGTQTYTIQWVLSS